MEPILTLTLNPSVDKSASVDQVVNEKKLRCSQARYEAGGGGINVSRAIHALGGDSTAMYTCGGPPGQMLQKALEEAGLNTSPSPIQEWTRVNFTANETSTGRQFRFNTPGPQLTEAEWQRCLEELKAVRPKPAYIVASGSLPPGVPDDFYARAAQIAKGLGSRMIVDTSEQALRLVAREGVYLIKPNLRELQFLAGSNIEEETQHEEAAQELIRTGQAEVVVVSLGATGALMASAQGCERLRSPAVPIRSRVGAGDSMVAGMVLSLAQGKSLKEAFRFGLAAGVAAVMTPGTELCRRADAERLFERMALEQV